MDELRYIFFGIGTLAFFATVYLAIQNPDLVERPIGEPQPEPSENPLRRWDHVITWIMWGSWGVAAIMTFANRAGYMEILEF